MGMGAVIAVLFILGGYLLIYNVFDIAVMQEIRRYGATGCTAPSA